MVYQLQKEKKKINNHCKVGFGKEVLFLCGEA